MIYHLKQVLCTHSQPHFHKMKLKKCVFTQRSVVLYLENRPYYSIAALHVSLWQLYSTPRT